MKMYLSELLELVRKHKWEMVTEASYVDDSIMVKIVSEFGCMYFRAENRLVHYLSIDEDTELTYVKGERYK